MAPAGCLFVSAAAAVIIAAAVVAAATGVTAAVHITAAIAEQEDQDDDPANVTTAETVVITHNTYLRDELKQKSLLIPR